MIGVAGLGVDTGVSVGSATGVSVGSAVTGAGVGVGVAVGCPPGPGPPPSPPSTGSVGPGVGVGVDESGVSVVGGGVTGGSTVGVGVGVGGVGGSSGGTPTVIVTMALPARPLVSVAVSVMTWPPRVRERLKDPPLPISPSLFDLHTRESPRRLPSSKSSPKPLKAILSVVRKLSKEPGLTMNAVGV